MLLKWKEVPLNSVGSALDETCIKIYLKCPFTTTVWRLINTKDYSGT